MEWLGLLMRWLHLASVILLIGSIAFIGLILQPALAKVSEEVRRSVLQNVRFRLKIVLHSAIAGVLLSGLYNTHLAWKTSVPPYPVIYLAKVLLALVVLAVAVIAIAKGPRESDPSPPGRWLTLCLILGVVIVALSAYLRTLHA